MDDDDRLRLEDFVPAAGGEWHGLLFASALLAVPSLSWCFEYALEDLPGDDGGSLGLTVEWVPVPVDSWRHMAGHRLTSARFSRPAEASVYHYIHHRFESVELTLADQDGPSLRVVAVVAGDIDRLGVDPVRVDARLGFGGMLVSLPGVTDPGEAFARLGQYTDTTGLVFDDSRATVALRFVPRVGEAPG